MEILVGVIGIVAGLAIGYLAAQKKAAKRIEEEQAKLTALQTAGARSEERASQLQKQCEGLQMEIAQERTKAGGLQSENASLKTACDNLNEKLAEQKQQLEEIQKKFTTEFENLANRIFEEKGKKFAEQNKLNLSEILTPLNEKIKDFQKKVEDTHVDQSKQQSSLQAVIKSLVDSNQKISKEANDLTNALKGSAKVRGDWGEMILESILEKSGLTRGREYTVQESFTDEHGKRFRTDVIVHYPGDKAIIIDSKVPLVAYERFSSADAQEEQQTHLAEHLQAIRRHINDLSGKNYQSLYQLKTVDFVMMFIPVEPAYMLAMQMDSGIWTYAYDRKVLLISPTNLIAALQMINSLWQQEYQSRNAQEIARQAGAMYDKFAGFVDDLIKVGNAMRSAQNTYEDAMKKLHTGRGNLVSSAEKMRELGAKAAKQLPEKLIERAED